MTFEEIHREEAESVGEPDDLPPEELHGVGPPCKRCGEREAMEGECLCHECIDEESPD